MSTAVRYCANGYAVGDPGNLRTMQTSIRERAFRKGDTAEEQPREWCLNVSWYERLPSMENCATGLQPNSGWEASQAAQDFMVGVSNSEGCDPTQLNRRVNAACDLELAVCRWR